MEYKCTKKEIQHIINNIIHVKLSNNKPKCKLIISNFIHVNNFIITSESLKHISKYKNSDIHPAINIHIIEFIILKVLPK